MSLRNQDIHQTEFRDICNTGPNSKLCTHTHTLFIPLLLLPVQLKISRFFFSYLTIVRNIVKMNPRKHIQHNDEFKVWFHARCQFSLSVYALKDFTFSLMKLIAWHCWTISVLPLSLVETVDRRLYSRMKINVFTNDTSALNGKWWMGIEKPRKYWRTNSPFDIYLIVYSHQKQFHCLFYMF